MSSNGEGIGQFLGINHPDNNSTETVDFRELSNRLSNIGGIIGDFGDDFGEFFNETSENLSELYNETLESIGITEVGEVTEIGKSIKKVYSKLLILENMGFIKEIYESDLSKAVLLGKRGTNFLINKYKQGIVAFQLYSGVIQNINSPGVGNINGPKTTNGLKGLNIAIKSKKRKKFAEYINKNRGRSYTKGGYCGKNVGNMMLSSGMPGIPTGGRHGYRYAGFLDGNKNYIKVPLNNPKDALAGGILVYGKNFGKSNDRQNYGHVELAMGNGRYWWGTEKNHPGGSIDAGKDPDNSGFIKYVYYPV